MKVATILPTPLLGMEPNKEYNMCLYHIVKSNDTYAKHFRELREQGQFVIMDNGAAEGVNPSYEELIPVYAKVHPSEIVLPDVVYNKVETIKRTVAAYNEFERNSLQEVYQFMAVPQGETFNDWLDCLTTFLSLPHITTIGVSKFVTPKFQKEMGDDANVRLECVDAIVRLAHRMKRPVQIHLLGCYDNPKEIAEINRIFEDVVRGTDSAIAYVYSRAGVKYEPNVDRPDNNEIDFHNGTVDDIELLQYNMDRWEVICND